MTNQDIVHLLKSVAAAYTIKDEKKYKFQIIAYQKAADAVEHASTELKNLYEQKTLENLSGIGPTIKSRLEELFETGRVQHFEEVLSGISPAVFPLLDIPTFGPKKAYKIVTHFNLEDPKTVIEDIKKLAEVGKIAELESFGEKSQDDIIRAISEYATGTTKTNRMVLSRAFSLATEVLEYLKKSPDLLEAYPLGSLRRMSSTIGDIDIAVTSKNPASVIQHFVDFPAKERVIEQGPTTASILIGGGKHVDLLVLPPEQFGSLLQHFTGSKHHNVALREYALKKGLSLSERGIKLLNDEKKLVEFEKEEDFYKYLGLDWIPPELRENLGEIELAQKNSLPKLVQLSDIKGDMHIHSNYPLDSSHDYGDASMEEMVQKAITLGYEYFGFSEHNPSVTNHSKNEIYSILERRKEKIEQIKKSNESIRIINLLEIDILASGELALDEKSFELIDAAIVSIHSSFNSPKDKMTKRILSGLAHPKAKIFAHPTGRLLNQRPGYDVDWDELFRFVAENNKALEINAWPERLDLPDIMVKDAKDRGVKFVIDTDSHALSHMDNMFYGVSVARRGWCEKKHILNTLPRSEFTEWINSI